MVKKKTFSNIRTYEKLQSVNKKKYETYIIKIQNRGKIQYLQYFNRNNQLFSTVQKCFICTVIAIEHSKVLQKKSK